MKFYALTVEVGNIRRGMYYTYGRNWSEVIHKTEQNYNGHVVILWSQEITTQEYSLITKKLEQEDNG